MRTGQKILTLKLSLSAAGDIYLGSEVSHGLISNIYSRTSVA